ncbi:hypothetical protein FRX31_033116 [Thalictrum thalictroides]|uniref:Uncharacterized protein n=1 Tax=Thalictrum thalictroides TaxID=46969 RepID=A0A7J6UXH5_THATH|nr:hypothetical protein FRX31_033116 [Thalictrum thalictroides]
MEECVARLENRFRSWGLLLYSITKKGKHTVASFCASAISSEIVNVCVSSFFLDSEVCNDIYLGSFAPIFTMEIPQSFTTLHLPVLIIAGWLTSTTTTIAASTLDKTMQLYCRSRSSVPDMEAVVSL